MAWPFCGSGHTGRQTENRTDSVANNILATQVPAHGTVLPFAAPSQPSSQPLSDERHFMRFCLAARSRSATLSIRPVVLRPLGTLIRPSPIALIRDRE